MLRWRLISAAVIIGTALLLIGIDFWIAENYQRQGLVLSLVAILVAMAGGGEVRELITAKGHTLRRGFCELGAGFVLLMASVPLWWVNYPADCPIGRLGWILFGVLGAMGGFFVYEIAKFREPNQIFERIALQTLAAAYVGGLLSFMAVLRDWHDNRWGLIAMISVIAIVKLSDTAAYAVGKTMGRHKMTPHLSPGKTIEGAVGAFVFGSFSGWLVLEILQWIFLGEVGGIAIWRCLVFGFVLSAAGMLGDLVESLLKRDAQIKDSSSWVPGLGGVLDIFDSMLVAAPVAYICWSTGLLPIPAN